MGLFDKLKGAMNAVTGGAAKVTLEYQPQFAYPGDNVAVRITATSTGAQVQSKGVFVDMKGTETILVRHGQVANVHQDINVHNHTLDQAFQIAPPFTLQPNETKMFEGGFQIPLNVPPTYQGPACQHKWELRGRVEAFGNDPDSGFLPFMVGRRQ